MMGLLPKFRYSLTAPQRIRLKLGDFDIPERLRSKRFDADREIEVEAGEIFHGLMPSLPLSRLQELAETDVCDDLLGTERILLRPARLALRYEMQMVCEAIEEMEVSPPAASPTSSEAISADNLPEAEEAKMAASEAGEVIQVSQAPEPPPQPSPSIEPQQPPPPPRALQPRVALPTAGSSERRRPRIPLFRRLQREQTSESAPTLIPEPKPPIPLVSESMDAGQSSRASGEARLDAQVGAPPPSVEPELQPPVAPLPDSPSEFAAAGSQAGEVFSPPAEDLAVSDIPAVSLPTPPEQAVSAVESAPSAPVFSYPQALHVEPVESGEERLSCEEKLQEIFMTEEPIGLERAIALCGGLPGIRSCILARGSQVLAAHNAPENLDLISLTANAVAMMEAVRATALKMGLGDIPVVTIHSEKGPVSFLHAADLSLLVLHADRGFVPGVRERLRDVLATLGDARLSHRLEDGRRA